jgi:hypothetical protein
VRQWSLTLRRPFIVAAAQFSNSPGLLARIANTKNGQCHRRIECDLVWGS